MRAVAALLAIRVRLEILSNAPSELHPVLVLLVGISIVWRPRSPQGDEPADTSNR